MLAQLADCTARFRVVRVFRGSILRFPRPKSPPLERRRAFVASQLLSQTERSVVLNGHVRTTTQARRNSGDLKSLRGLPAVQPTAGASRERRASR